MLDREEHQLIIDASVLYYLEGKTQNEIAKALYLSRPKVSRLLKKARDLQIVDITINYQNDEFENLQGEMRRRFSVNNVIISKTLTDEADTLREVGKAAAKELEMILTDNLTIGISWGKHVRMMASYLKKHPYQNLRVVELFGAISYDLNQVDMLSIGRSISSKLNGRLYPLPSPIYINDPLARKAIIETPLIKSTLNMIDECDFIVTGIGSLESSSLQTLWDNYVASDMKEQIVDNFGVGFILAHFFDENGEFLKIDVNDCVVGIRTETIRDKKIIAIASGVEKARAIMAALKGGLIDTLVSDEETIRLILKLSM